MTVIVPQAVALKNVPDVELVAVGSWQASTGKATITNDDIRAALSALDCPGIHNPVIKLGHMEPDPDEQRMRWDGTPAVGWVSNMRLSDNGAKILGDYTGVPGWLADVMPSAYPQRSVEIQRDFLCQIGHVHPFVITAVSLLGVFPPAVGVIKSLHDVQALYTLAAYDHGDPPTEVVQSIQTRLAVTDPADQRRQLSDAERASTADFDRDRREWDAAVNRLMEAWPTIGRQQRDQLTAQIARHIDTGQLDALAGMAVTSEAAKELIAGVMLASAAEAADEQAAEAARQGVPVEAVPEPDSAWVEAVAVGIAGAMAATLAATAARTAAQLAAPGLSGTDVADATADKLADLSDRFVRDQFGGAVGAARMEGRYTVLSVLPSGQYFASERNDSNTCDNCRAIDGKLFDTLDEAMGVYGAGGYRRCSGGGRCRGRLVTVWNLDAAPVRNRLAVRVGGRTVLGSVETFHLPGKHDQKSHGNKVGKKDLVQTKTGLGRYAYLQRKGTNNAHVGDVVRVVNAKDTPVAESVRNREATVIGWVNDNRAELQFTDGEVTDVHKDFLNVVRTSQELAEDARKGDRAGNAKTILKGHYGDRLKVIGNETEMTRHYLNELAKAPPRHHAVVSKHMSGAAKGGIYIGHAPVTELSPYMATIKDEQPRGYPKGAKFSGVGGVYVGGRFRELAIGVGPHGSGSHSVATHELGHALDDTLTSDQRKQWRDIYKLLDRSVMLNPYYHPMMNEDGHHSESFAELYAVWSTGGNADAGIRTIGSPRFDTPEEREAALKAVSEAFAFFETIANPKAEAPKPGPVQKLTPKNVFALMKSGGVDMQDADGNWRPVGRAEMTPGGGSRTGGARGGQWIFYDTDDHVIRRAASNEGLPVRERDTAEAKT